MPGYEYHFVEAVAMDVICLLCRLPMREPVRLSSCGHRFCDSCLQQFLRDRLMECPKDGSPLDYGQIFSDTSSAAAVAQLTVFCPHCDTGCGWRGRVDAVAGHGEACSYRRVACTGCGALTPRRSLADHMRLACPSRAVDCQYCGLRFSARDMQSHQGRCEREMVWCENKCGARLEQRYLSAHASSECHKRVVPCRFCGKQFVFETLQEHHHQCMSFPVSCPNRCRSVSRLCRSDLEHHVALECESTVQDCPFREVGCEQRVRRSDLAEHVEVSMNEHLRMMCGLALRQESTIRQLTERLEASTRLNDGIFVWRIENMTKLMQSDDSLVKSPAFYTAAYGFKMRACLFPNGNGTGRGTHVSVYVRLLPGDFDDILEWPFLDVISLELLDQTSEKRRSVIETFSADSSCPHFQRPTCEDDSMGFGYPRFISIEKLRAGNFIKKDAIFVRIRVEQEDKKSAGSRTPSPSKYISACSP